MLAGGLEMGFQKFYHFSCCILPPPKSPPIFSSLFSPSSPLCLPPPSPRFFPSSFPHSLATPSSFTPQLCNSPSSSLSWEYETYVTVLIWVVGTGGKELGGEGGIVGLKVEGWDEMGEEGGNGWCILFAVIRNDGLLSPYPIISR